MPWRKRIRPTRAVPVPDGLARRDTIKELGPPQNNSTKSKWRANRKLSKFTRLPALASSGGGVSAAAAAASAAENEDDDLKYLSYAVKKRRDREKRQADVAKSYLKKSLVEGQRARDKLYQKRFTHVNNIYAFLSQDRFHFCKSLRVIFGTKFAKKTVSCSHMTSVLTLVFTGCTPTEMEKMVVPVYQAFDRQGRDQMPFGEFLCCYRLSENPFLTPVERLEDCFDCFDYLSTGYVTREEVDVIFRIGCTAPGDIEAITIHVAGCFGKCTAKNRNNPIPKQLFMLAARNNPQLTQLFHEQIWAVIPAYVRQRVVEKQVKDSERDFRIQLNHINWRRARAFFEPLTMRRRWRRWRAYVLDCKLARKGYRHWKKRRQRATLARMLLHARRKIAEKARLKRARSFWRVTRINDAMDDWMVYCDYWNRRWEEGFKRAARHFFLVTTRKIFDEWKMVWYMNRSYHFWSKHLKRRVMTAWCIFMDELRAKRAHDEKAATLRQHMDAYEAVKNREHAELLAMRIEEEKQRAIEAEIKAILEEKRKQEEYKRMLKEAAKRALDRRKLLKQWEARVANKAAIKAAFEKKQKATWTFLQEQTMERNRVECKRWLFNTLEGKVRLKLDIRKLMKAWEDCWEGVTSPTLSEWEAVYEPKFEAVFWVNSRTMERLGADDVFTKKEAERIAVEQFIAARTEEELKRFEAVKAREIQKTAEERAAIVIQQLYRVRVNKGFMRAVSATIWIKVMDPEEHHYYYYNELQEHKSGVDRKGKKGARKPYILGRFEDLEPDIWQMRYKKENTRLEFYNIKKPWESSYQCPQGFVKCYLCNKWLARRQHIEGVSVRSGEIIAGGKYCQPCYLDEFGKKPFVNFKNWNRHRVAKQKCIFCGERWSDLLCYECDSSYCSTCSPLFHSQGVQRNHTQIVPF